MRSSKVLGAFALAAVLLTPLSASAGEVLFSADPFETDGDGKLKSGARGKATKKLKSEPGEELWHLSLWAKIDKGAPGPLYVEFHGKLSDGRAYQAPAHEHTEYAGDEFVNLTFDLEGSRGFNKGHTYTVKLVQVGKKKKDIVLASSKLTLEYVEAKEGEDDGGEDDDGGETEASDSSAQDELDTLVGGEGNDAGDGPPPVTPPGKKKGCYVDPNAAYSVPGLLVLFALGAGLARRRSS